MQKLLCLQLGQELPLMSLVKRESDKASWEVEPVKYKYVFHNYTSLLALCWA